MADNGAFGWGDEVEVKEGAYTLLPEGEALFTVTKLTRQRKEFGKFGVCNVAIITCLCTPVDGDGEAEIDSQIALHQELGWKIMQLATACGFRKHGEGNKIDPRWWAMLEAGGSGRCMIKHRTFPSKRDGKDVTVNEIAEFLAPEQVPDAPQEEKPAKAAGKGKGEAKGKFAF